MNARTQRILGQGVVIQTFCTLTLEKNQKDNPIDKPADNRTSSLVFASSSEDTTNKTSIKILDGIRVGQTYCPLAAAYVVKWNLADIVVVKVGKNLEDLKNMMMLLGGSRDSGPFDTIRDIRVDLSKSKSIAESSLAHPPHTDGSFEKNSPKHFLLQIVECDESGGGVSTFFSISSMLKAMPEELRSSLSVASVAFGRADDTGRFDAHVGPIVYSRLDGTEGFRWRDDDQVSPKVVDAKGTKIEEAIGWIKDYLKATLPLLIAGHEGEVFVINNDRVFHGRTPLSGKRSKRWIRRAWLAETR